MSKTSVPFGLNILIAGMPTRLFFANLPFEMQKLLQDWYAAFSITGDHIGGRQDTLNIEARVEPGDLFIPFQPGPCLVHTYRQGDRIMFESHQEKGWFDLGRNWGELTLRPEGNPENFLRVVYAWRCLDHNALLLHASGVILNNYGYVFFGPSGSGKTTTARLSSDAIILSDDLVILMCESVEDRTNLRVYGVPFRGEMIEAGRANASAKLLGLYTLVKDSSHRLVEMNRIEAAARLTACVPFVMSQPENAQRVLALCDEFTRLVAVKALHFSRDAGFWKVINE